ncbi:hypothetical protein HY256_02765, partial [Candidatus Sumerlaeota bacterium]|nr:hypothetical protein [Candidatus Sumerlaeota bacterium]
YAGESEVLKLLLDPVYNMEERGYKLLQAALQGGGGDNISIVLIRVESLDPAKDNWNPETASNPSMPKPQMIPPMPTPASTVDPSQVAGSKSRTGLIAALTLILLVGILLFVLINRGGKVAQVVLDGIPNINEAEITLLDSVGQPLPEIEVDRDGDLLTLHLTKNAEYILEIKGPGIVPVRTSVDFTHNTGKPIKITIKEMARVSIQVPPGSAIASLKIISDPANGGKTVYEYPNNKDAAPKLELEIMPEVPYQVSIEDTAGKIFSNQINVAPGGTEFVNMQF